jgi:hypothetical protein
MVRFQTGMWYWMINSPRTTALLVGGASAERTVAMGSASRRLAGVSNTPECPCGSSRTVKHGVAGLFADVPSLMAQLTEPTGTAN